MDLTEKNQRRSVGRPYEHIHQSSLDPACNMKVPPITDPRWTEFIQSRRDYPLKCLATRIMYGQAKLLAQRDPAQAIRLAYEYFQKNEALAAQDLQTVFGRGPHG